MEFRVSVTQSLAAPVGDHFPRHHTLDHLGGGDNPAWGKVEDRLAWSRLGSVLLGSSVASGAGANSSLHGLAIGPQVGEGRQILEGAKSGDVPGASFLLP